MENEPSVKREYTKQETDKKCPACGGVMDFSPETGGLVCAYCEYAEQIDISDDAPAREIDFAQAENAENCNWGEEKKTIICKSCAAESIYDALIVANECPYCGSNQVMEEKGRDTMAPGGVVPFKITVQQSAESFIKWIKKKLFCPRKAKKMAKPEAFKGVYLPFWTFDVNTVSHYTGAYGKSRTVRDSKGNTRTVIDWYNTAGCYETFFDDELTPGTNAHDARMLKSLEPFNTADNKGYKPEYIAGFIAERYSVGLSDAWSNAKSSIDNKIENGISDKICAEHFTSHSRVYKVKSTYDNLKFKYLMLPIWLSSFKYRGKVYQFMVNGETGKVAGKTPVSVLRVIIAVLLALAVILLIFSSE